VFTVLLYDSNEAIEAKDSTECSLEEDVPEQYHEFLGCSGRLLRIGFHCIDQAFIIMSN
jgi:hypothetical protein